jgi:hypothetical protein
MEISMERGKDVPAIRDQPQLTGEASEVARAFRILSKTRTAGLDANPINLGEIKHYIDIFGTPWFGMDMFVDLLTDMDVRFMEVHRESAKKVEVPEVSEEESG